MRDATRPIAPLSYRRMRLRHCRSALRDFLRRWGTYLLVGAAVGGIGSPALAAGAVLPLFHSVASPVWAGPAVLAYVLVGAGLLWAMRSLLWPQAWAECERALPIPRGQRWLSDLQVVALALLPLALLQGLGALVVLQQDPAWLRPRRGLALAALGLCLLGAGGLALMGLQLMRQAGARGSALARHPPTTLAALAPWQRHWVLALIAQPLWRGPARRTGLGLLLGTVLLLAPGLLLHLQADWASWCLAGFAALSLAVVSRLNALAHLELGPLLAASAVLPISPHRPQLARAALVLLPAVLGLSATMVVMLAGAMSIPLRPLVTAAFVAVNLGAWSFEALTVPRDPAHKAARWLLSLALSVALASEVVA